MNALGFKLSLDNGDNDDFIGDTGSLSKAFTDFMDEPRLTKPQTIDEQPIAQWATVIAKVVFAYKLVNQLNEAQGKVGLAVIKSEQKHRIILYRTKQLVLSTFSLEMTSKVYNKHGYVQYQDDDHCFWSIRFEIDERLEFLQTISQICSIENEPETTDPPSAVIDDDELTLEPAAPTTKQPTKLSIVNRMAKMGRQLPQMTRSTDLPDDSGIEEVATITSSSYRPVVPKWKPDMTSRIAAQELFPYNAATASSVQPILASSTLISYNPSMMTGETGLNSFLAENRIQNSEVRMNLSKLETKIERVMDKIDALHMEKPPRRVADSEDEILRLEEKILSLKKVNRQLRLSMEEMTERGQRDTDAERLEAATKRNVQLQQELDAKVTDIKRLTRVIVDKSAEVEIFRKNIEKLTGEYETDNAEKLAKLEAQNKQFIGMSDKIAALEALQDERLSEIKSLQSQMEKERIDFNMKIQLLEEARSEMAPVSVAATVKDIMNNLYQTLYDQLADRNALSAQEFLKIARVLIKKETTSVLGDSRPSV